MSEIPKINRNIAPLEGSEAETSKKITSPEAPGVSSTPDELAPAAPNLFQQAAGDSSSAQSIRETILEARAEGKLPLTENYLNRFISENLQQSKAEAGTDLKGWLTKNFYLTPVQQQEVKSMSAEDIKLAQDAIAKAAESDAGVRVRIADLAPDTEQKQLKLLEAKQETERQMIDLDLAWGKIKGLAGQEEAIKKALEEKLGGGSGFDPAV